MRSQCLFDFFPYSLALSCCGDIIARIDILHDPQKGEWRVEGVGDGDARQEAEMVKPCKDAGQRGKEKKTKVMLHDGQSQIHIYIYGLEG